MARSLYLVNPAADFPAYFSAEASSGPGYRPAAMIGDGAITTVAAMAPADVSFGPTGRRPQRGRGHLAAGRHLMRNRRLLARRWRLAPSQPFIPANTGLPCSRDGPYAPRFGHCHPIRGLPRGAT